MTTATQIEPIIAPRAIPTLDNFLVLRDEAVTVSEAGIHTPKQAVAAKQTGTIVAVGPGVRDGIKPGNRVIWAMEFASEIEIDGTPYLNLHESDVACFLLDLEGVEVIPCEESNHVG